MDSALVRRPSSRRHDASIACRGAAIASGGKCVCGWGGALLSVLSIHGVTLGFKKTLNVSLSPPATGDIARKQQR